MANFPSIARPYALAAFQYAKEQNDLAAWQLFLNMAARIIDDKQVTPLLNLPAINQKDLLNLLSGLLQPYLNEARLHFLKLLAENTRFVILPEIASQFTLFLSQLKKTSQVRLITAVDVDETFKKHLAERIAKRTQQEVSLTCETDPNILGGAIIHLGDTVIDGSIRSKLSRLESSLR